MNAFFTRDAALARIEDLKASASDALHAVLDEIGPDGRLEGALFRLAASRADSFLRQAEITRVVHGLPPDPDLPFVPLTPIQVLMVRRG